MAAGHILLEDGSGYIVLESDGTSRIIIETDDFAFPTGESITAYVSDVSYTASYALSGVALAATIASVRINNWSPITDGSNTWTPISPASDSWTEIAPSTNDWDEI